MTAINLPSLSFNIDESSNKETLNNILDTLQLYRKELNFLLMNLDGDNMPSILGRIEDGEGNISNISQTVDEISMTVANSAGDISNLQITANQISAKVADAQGNIAALDITAKGLTSTVASHTGDISSIRQTATSIQQQVASQAGDISSIKQTATSIQTQVTDQKGQISTLTQTANGLQTQVTNNSNRVTQITQTVEGIQSTVAYQDRQLGYFRSDITQLSNSISSKVSYTDYNGREIVSLIEQTPGYIKLRADKIELDGITHVNRSLRLGTGSDMGSIQFSNSASIRASRYGYGHMIEIYATDLWIDAHTHFNGPVDGLPSGRAMTMLNQLDDYSVTYDSELNKIVVKDIYNDIIGHVDVV